MNVIPQSIAFVCDEYPSLPHGGIGTFVQMLGRALVGRGYRVRVVGLYDPALLAGGQERELDQGVEVYRLAMPKGGGAGRLGGALAWYRARKLLYDTVAGWARAGEIDLVEVPDAGGWAAWWPKLPVPVIARVHGSGSYFRSVLGQERSRLLFAIERASMRRVDNWCAVSRFSGEQTRALFGLGPVGAISNVPVSIPPPVDFAGRVPNRVVYTGTLTAKKGILSLARAWNQVKKECPDAELHVFGKDKLAGAGEMMSARARAEISERWRESVVFHGHTRREQVLAELGRAWTAVFPSYAEAFAFAPMEAMATGCPTIYSLRTSGPELIEEGVNGFLIDPDDATGIARAITRLLGNAGEAERIGAAGRERVERNFTPAILIPRMEQFYREAAGRFHGGAAGTAGVSPAITEPRA